VPIACLVYNEVRPMTLVIVTERNVFLPESSTRYRYL